MVLLFFIAFNTVTAILVYQVQNKRYNFRLVTKIIFMIPPFGFIVGFAFLCRAIFTEIFTSLWIDIKEYFK